MQASITYDDAKLQQLFAELEPKRRLQTMRAAFRREANAIRKAAINNLRADGPRSSRAMEKGIRAIVYKRTAGFRVTVGTGKNDAGMYTNRRGLKKPVLMWAEIGTDRRNTRTRSRVFTRSRKGHYTGQMRRYGFMRRTREQVADKVTEELRQEIVNQTIKASKKYGCK